VPSPSAPASTAATGRRPARRQALKQAAIELLIPLTAAALVVGVHVRWLAGDTSHPVGDAAGHLVNVARHVGWLQGGRLPSEAFPPGLYVVSAWFVTHWGADFEHARWGTALFAGLMAAGLSWTALRAAGPVAGALAPLAGLAAPYLSAASRDLLLDLPATALIVWIWGLCWASGGYRRRGPTVLMGLALGCSALVKYTCFIWVMPALFGAGVWMVVRAPSSLLPLALLAWPIRASLHALVGRAGDPPEADAKAWWPGIERAEIGVVGAAVALVVSTHVLRRRRPELWPRTRDGLADGGWLVIAACVALAVAVPWFLHAMPAVWTKVQQEAIDEVRTSGVRNSLVAARVMLRYSWPGGWWLLQAALGLEAAWLGLQVVRRLRGRPVEALGPTLLLVACVAPGAWFSARNLPFDIRYYLPVLAAGALVLGVAAARFPTRWFTGPALAAVCAWQVFLPGLGGRAPVALPWPEFDVRRVVALDPWGPMIPPRPRSQRLDVAISELLPRVAAAARSGPSPRVLLATPDFSAARGAHFEGRGLVALLCLAGLPEHAVAEWSGGAPQGRTARFLAEVLPLAEASSRHSALGVELGEPLWKGDADGFVVRLYALP
jgi:hypothetical protein